MPGVEYIIKRPIRTLPDVSGTVPESAIPENMRDVLVRMGFATKVNAIDPIDTESHAIDTRKKPEPVKVPERKRNGKGQYVKRKRDE